jgi:uridine monophosphate synthetase
MQEGFFGRLEGLYREKDSLLCVGLDPALRPDHAGIRQELRDENARIVEKTAPYVIAYKPNIAFYEAYGIEGLLAFQDTLDLIPKEIPVIIDAKRCDIGNTAEAYAASIFGHYKADAVTLSPYMGKDAALPFLKHAGKGIFVLVRNSNPSAIALQDLQLKNGDRLYEAVARECLSWGSHVGFVAAGNDYEALRRLREIAPDTWFLAPGIGAQGGEADQAMVVRAICAAPDPAEAARDYRDTIRRAVSRR